MYPQFRRSLTPVQKMSYYDGPEPLEMEVS
jgi:hypothetical protein